MARLFAITSCFLLLSCATVLNGPSARIKIYTTARSKIIVGNDTVTTVNNKAKFTVRRGTEALRIVALSDSTRKEVSIKPINSFAYYYNIVSTVGIGMLAEKKNSRRYAYPSPVYFNSFDTVNVFYRYPQENNKGKYRLHLSLPHINSFLLHPEGEPTKTSAGFWGLSIGVDHFHKRDQFLTLSIAVAADLPVPVPAAVDFSGERDFMNTAFIAPTNNHQIKRFSVGYGLCLSKNTWDLRYYSEFNPPPPSRTPVKKTSSAAGLVFPFYYTPGHSFFIGTVYRPTLFRISPAPSLLYEHLLSIDFGWKIQLCKKAGAKNEN